MPINVLMPALSPTMEEGKLAKWVKKEGDAVKPGDVIAEIETDKATMEVEAVDEGTVGKILVAEGTEGVKVNTPIAVIVARGRGRSRGEAPAPARRRRQADRRQRQGAGAPSPSASPAGAEADREGEDPAPRSGRSRARRGQADPGRPGRHRDGRP